MQIENLNIDGELFPIADQPDNIKRIVDIYNLWTLELGDLEVEQLKLQKALAALEGDIVATFNKNVADSEGEDSEESTTDADATKDELPE